MSEWVDDPQPAPQGDWEDDAGDWVDEAHAKPKEAPGWGTKALQLLSKGTKARDMFLAGNPVSRAMWTAYRAANPDPAAKDKLVTSQDVKDLFTKLDGGLDATDLLKRGGVRPSIAGPLGLTADILLPGDPTGAALGKAFTGFKVAGKAIPGLADPLRWAGLRKLLARVPWNERPATFQALKEAGVVGGVKNQAKIVNQAVDAADHAVTASVQRAADSGLTPKTGDFLQEASSYLDEFGRTAATGDVGGAAQYAENIAKEAARVRPAEVGLPFFNQQRKAIGSTGNKAEQEIRKMLRARLVKDAGKEGAAIDKGLIKESQLIRARQGADAAANAPFSFPIAPTIGAVIGAGNNLQFGDDFSLGSLGRGALWGAIGARALTSPRLLTRGAQLLDNYGGRTAAQSAYRLIKPEEEK